MDQFFSKFQTLESLRQGPLDIFLDEFADQLSREGYGIAAARRQIRTIADFSAWLKRNRVFAQQITPVHVEKFLKYMVRKRPLRSTDPSALKRMMAVLHQQGVISNEVVLRLQPTPAEQLRDEFVSYLFKERGLAKSSVLIYQTFIALFLNDRFANGDVLPSALITADIVSFVRRQALSLQPVGDGALGFWSALPQVFGETRWQRCWMHKTGNVLDKLPKHAQARAKDNLHQIWMAETKAEAEKAFDHFIESYELKYPKATECLAKDRGVLLTFYDFPAEHWTHLRTTNPVESMFATVRLRTNKTRGMLTRDTMLTMIFKLSQSAQQRWRRLNGTERLGELIEGVKFVDGIKQEKEAA